MDGGEVIPDELVVLILSHSDMSTKGKFLSLSKKWNSEANRNMNFSVKQHGRERIEVLKDKNIELEKVFRRNNMGEEYLNIIRWYKDGYKDKEDGPAEIGWYPNGMKSHEFWYYKGNFFRKQSGSGSGPTTMQWWPNGRPQKEEWIKNNRLYRKDKKKPSKTRWYENGYKQSEWWANKNGVLHRDDGPAEIQYYEKNGKIASEFWYKNGVLHRENAPAIINYNEKGEKVSSVWYLNGNFYRENEIQFH